jgi:hypothetical protein
MRRRLRYDDVLPAFAATRIAGADGENHRAARRGVPRHSY